ncbi:MAG TPA: dienelactone hydrolase [Planctomycetaceae bacterium]|nr:dienelactone hydrolase [Planctomycetaceae bacterium]
MHRSLNVLGGAAAALICLGLCVNGFAQAAYNPLSIPDTSKSPVGEPIDLTVQDAKRKREVPIRVYLPSEKIAAPVVMFSHGLGGSREGSSYLGRHWSARGYAVVFLQHPGSDESVWRDVPMRQRMQTLKGAASVQNFKDRVDDVRVTIDHLEMLNAQASGPFAGRLDTKRLGMSGHSFGAVTTQAVSGQRQPIGGSLTEKRIKAAVVMSPNRPQNKLVSVERAFSEVQIPWLLMTGTKDDSPIGDTTPESRLAVFPALPPGDKFELVLKDANHYAFTERSDGPRTTERNPQHWNTILALSTAFWDAYLREDEAAKQWLVGKDARSVLSPGDRWQMK